MGRLAISLVLVAIVFVAGCDGGTSLQGVVVGMDDTPIAGAKVRFFVDEVKEQERPFESTDENGCYSIARTHAPFDIPLVVTVTKEGYKPYRKEFNSRDRDGFPKRIVLEPEAKVAKD